MMKELLVFICAFLMFSCSQKLSCMEYIDHTQQHHEEFEVKIESNITYTLEYAPVERMIAENIVADASLKQELKENLKGLAKSRSASFQLKLATKGGNLFSQNPAPKAEQVKYYSVDFKNAVFAVSTSNDTLPCSGYLFQPNGGFGNDSYFEFDIALPIMEIKEILISPKYLTDSVIVFNLAGLHHEYPTLKIK